MPRRALDGPPPERVKEIEVSGKNKRLRLVLALTLLAVGLVAIGLGVHSLLNADPGWTEITVSDYTLENCSADFTLRYYLTPGSATAENKAVTDTYTRACRRGYTVFHPTQTFDDLGNLATVNRSLNKEVSVAPELYQALTLLEDSGARLHYLGPVYEANESLLHSVTDEEMRQADPRTDPETADFVAKAVAFAADPKSVQLHLLGDNRVRLEVSDAYAAFLQDYEVATPLDLSWMKNAFIIDLLADSLTSAGWTHGVLGSVDGFSRVLDASGDPYSQTLLTRGTQGLAAAGVATVTCPISLVAYHDAAQLRTEGDFIYTLENGETRTAYLDPADGLCRSAVHDLVAYSYQAGCAEVMLATAPLYIADHLEEAALSALTARGIYAILPGETGLSTNEVPPGNLRIAPVEPAASPAP